MPEPKRPLKVFLCHASTDKPKVRELYRYLKKRGIQPWFDEEDLVGGQDWQVEIPKALTTSDAIIICLTKNSVDKEGYIQKEIKFALDKALEMPEGRIFLIPVKFEECEVPFTLSRYQWVDLMIASGYAKMLKALKFRASQLERSTVEVSKKNVEEENLAREKAEKEAAEKARLKAEELARQKSAKEKAEREAIEKNKRETEKKKLVTVKSKASGQVPYWFGGFIFLVLGVIFLSSLNNPSTTPQPTPENTQTQEIVTLPQNTIEPSETTAPKATSMTVSTLTPTSSPTEITDAKGVPMIFVPSGDFVYVTYKDVKGYTDDYYIDKYEVTNKLYKECMKARFCTELYDNTFLDDPDYTNHPVVYIYPYQADALCKWRGAKLPNGSWWVKAARGSDARKYPWGNEPDLSRANFYGSFDNYYTTTAPVGSFATGVSPYGVYDMAGNVEELTSDVNDNYSGGSRETRGTSWQDDGLSNIFDYHYNHNTGSTVNEYTGFRCAKDATP